jgi:hypothetical protein
VKVTNHSKWIIVQSVKMKKIGRSSANKDTRVFAAADAFALLLDELDPDEVELPFEDEEVVEPNRGFKVTVVLFMHWLDGNSVAFLLKVMSAHCWDRS